MANPLYSIPGLGGYLATDDMRQQQDARQIQQAIGLASLLERRRAAEQEAQLAPLKMQLMQAEADQARGLAAQREQEASFNNALLSLIPQAMGEDGQIDYGKLSGLLMQQPGGLKPGMDLRRVEEDRRARLQQSEQSNLLRQQQLTQQHEERLRRAQNDAERLQAQRDYQQGMLALRAETNAIRRESGGGGGGGKLFPFRYSVGGKNVQGWRDQAGNFYDAERRPMSNVEPEITAADQALARKNAEETAAVETMRGQLAELETLAARNPRSVAGPLSGLTRGLEAVATTIVPGSVGLQATTSQQLIRSIISNLPKTGRISNYQQLEMRRLFEDGLSGNAESLQKGIELLRQNLGSREAAIQAPVGRARPGGSVVPPPPPGFKVD